MVERTKQVLAVEAAAAMVRGMVLRRDDDVASAGGYAQLVPSPGQDPAAVAVRIAIALDPETELPVVVTGESVSPDRARETIEAGLRQAGFQSVGSVSSQAATDRVRSAQDEDQSLRGADIPAGLLSSHPGLTVEDLAPIVGAGILLLDGDVEPQLPQETGGVAVWSPASTPPPATDVDPFTGSVIPPDTERADDAAATLPADSSVVIDDDDETVAADSAAVDEIRAAAASSAAIAAAGTAATERTASDDRTESTTVEDEPTADAAQPVGVDDDTVLRAGSAGLVEAVEDDDTESPKGSVEAVEDDDTELPPAPVVAVEDDDTELPPAPVVAVEDDDTELPPAPVEAVEDDETVSWAGPAGSVEAVQDDDTDLPAAAAVPSPATEPPHDPLASRNQADVDFGGNRRNPSRLFAVLAAIVVSAVVLALLISQCGGDEESDPAAVAAGAQAEPGDGASDADPDDPDNPDADDSDGVESDEQSATVANQAGTAVQDDEPTVEPTARPAPTATVEPDPTSTPEPEPTATTEPEPTPEPTSDSVADLPPLSSLPERGAIFRPPTLFLEGPVQTQEQADALYQAAIAVVGPDNVQNDYVIRPDAPPALDGNVRVEQAVLFQTGSAVIAEEFIPTLDLGVLVMNLNPQVEMIVQGHTDSVGSDEINLALSQRRAQAVVEYLVSRGVDRERLTPIGLGEGEPVAPNDTEANRQINRRIEVELLDLLSAD